MSICAFQGRARCWACMTNNCYEPYKWHQWADFEDIEHAAKTGQPDPSGQQCGCWCAEPEKEEPKP